MTAACREQYMTDNIIPFTDPNSDPVQDKLAPAHDDKAVELGVEFTNWGWATDENGICSKTTKGILDSSINPNTMQVSHSWITYEERARCEEQQKKTCGNALGKVRGLLSATAKAASTVICRSNGICADLGGVRQN
jgi:hypothetical protein